MTVRARRPIPDRELRAAAKEAVDDMFWIIPFVFAVGATLAAYVSFRVDDIIEGSTWWSGSSNAAASMLRSIAGSMLPFLGVVFSISMVALQLASQQFSPRVTRTFVRSMTAKVTLGVFMATFIYALLSLNRVERQSSPEEAISTPVTIAVALLLTAASLFAFIAFLSSITRLVRVAPLIVTIADVARSGIAVHYPSADAYMAVEPPRLDHRVAEIDTHETDRRGWRRTRGVLVFLHHKRLVELARIHGCVIRISTRIGENLGSGMKLAEIYGESALTPDQLRRAFLFGDERSAFQDPSYAIRELVDIAVQALSPAINAPTTTVQVIDRLTDVLGRIGVQPDPTGLFADRDGIVRLVVPTIDWPDLVNLVFTEVRVYGARAPQVTRRLAASIDHLIATLPQERLDALTLQRDLLRRAVEELYPDEEQRRLALHPDSLGLG